MSANGRTHWGWHQLDDREARRLVRDAGVHPGDLVLDIGAGTGALTAPLVAAGARVVAVELHPGRAAMLRERFVRSAVTVVQADASDLRLPRRPFRVVANPPFAASTAILRRLLHPGSRLVRADLVLPLPVAARWAGGRAPATRRWTVTFDASLGRHLRPSSFHPPHAGTAVLTLVRRS